MKEPRYGNWISSKLVAASLAAAFALLIGARLAVGHSRLLVGVLLAATLIAMAAASRMLAALNTTPPRKALPGLVRSA